jgi:hypothetical protein
MAFHFLQSTHDNVHIPQEKHTQQVWAGVDHSNCQLQRPIEQGSTPWSTAVTAAAAVVES